MTLSLSRAGFVNCSAGRRTPAQKTALSGRTSVPFVASWTFPSMRGMWSTRRSPGITTVSACSTWSSFPLSQCRWAPPSDFSLRKVVHANNWRVEGAHYISSHRKMSRAMPLRTQLRRVCVHTHILTQRKWLRSWLQRQLLSRGLLFVRLRSQNTRAELNLPIRKHNL